MFFRFIRSNPSAVPMVRAASASMSFGRGGSAAFAPPALKHQKSKSRLIGVGSIVGSGSAVFLIKLFAFYISAEG